MVILLNLNSYQLFSVFFYSLPYFPNFLQVFGQDPTKVGPQTYDFEHLFDFSCLTFVF